MPLLIRMSEATCIALHVLAYVASKQATVNAIDLAKICRASEAHTMKVCQRLKKTGILSARRGPGGGFTLTRDPTGIRLSEIFNIFDGPMEIGHCLFSSPVCKEKNMRNCIFGNRIGRINQQIVNYFTETKLSDISANCHRALASRAEHEEKSNAG